MKKNIVKSAVVASLAAVIAIGSVPAISFGSTAEKASGSFSDTAENVSFADTFSFGISASAARTAKTREKHELNFYTQNNKFYKGYMVEAGGVIELPVAPAVEGYIFVKWVPLEGDKAPEDYKAMPSKDLKFKPLYVLDGGRDSI